MTSKYGRLGLLPAIKTEIGAVESKRLDSRVQNAIDKR